MQVVLVLGKVPILGTVYPLMRGGCQDCTATCIGGQCSFWIYEITAATNSIELPIAPEVIEEPLKYNQKKGDRRGYWKSNVDRRFRR